MTQHSNDWQNALDLDVAVLMAVRPQRRIKQVNADQKTLGGWLAARRLELRQTQTEVAKRAGIGTSCLSQIERGVFNPIRSVEKIAKALDCEIPAELMPRPKERKRPPGPYIERTSDTGRFVTERRLELGITQAELARRAGTSQTYVSFFEHGQKIPSNVVESICRALDIQVPVDLAQKEGEKPVRSAGLGRSRRRSNYRARRASLRRAGDDLDTIIRLSDIGDESEATRRALRLLRRLLEKQQEGYTIRLVKGDVIVELELLL